MVNSLLFKKPVILNRDLHGAKKVKLVPKHFFFASGVNSVFLAGAEFRVASKEFPIVFTKASGKVIPVVLLGLREKENLFVDDQGAWDAAYIPSFIRRYPFALAELGEGEPQAVCIDEDYEGFDDFEGEALFSGEEISTDLQNVMAFLERYQFECLQTDSFVDRLRDNDLLISFNAKVDMANGEEFGLKGLYSIDEKKLRELQDDKVLEIFRSGELYWIYCQLLSLENFGGMVKRAGYKGSKSV